MKGNFFSGDEYYCDPHRALLLRMITITYQHANFRELDDVAEKYRKNEIYESRCYILSDKFEKDCLLVDDVMTPAVIDEVRKCRWSTIAWHRCVVCGRYADNQYSDYWICDIHQKIIKAYNEDPDIEEEVRIAEEKRKPKKDRQVYLPYWRRVKESCRV